MSTLIAEENCVRPLTQREYQVALLIADGHTNDEIGDRLDISPRTVKAISDNIRRKLEVEHRRRIGAALRSRGMM